MYLRNKEHNPPHIIERGVANLNAAEQPDHAVKTEILPAAAMDVTPQMKTVLDYLLEYGEISDVELQELLNVKKTRAYLIARQMSENGLIETEGRGAAKKYKLK